jgi:hypothetical protein
MNGRRQAGGWEEYVTEYFRSKYTTKMYENIILIQAPMAIAYKLRYLGDWDEDDWVHAIIQVKEKQN